MSGGRAYVSCTHNRHFFTHSLSFLLRRHQPSTPRCLKITFLYRPYGAHLITPSTHPYGSPALRDRLQSDLHPSTRTPRVPGAPVGLTCGRASGAWAIYNSRTMAQADSVNHLKLQLDDVQPAMAQAPSLNRIYTAVFLRRSTMLSSMWVAN